MAASTFAHQFDKSVGSGWELTKWMWFPLLHSFVSHFEQRCKSPWKEIAPGGRNLINKLVKITASGAAIPSFIFSANNPLVKVLSTILLNMIWQFQTGEGERGAYRYCLRPLPLCRLGLHWIISLAERWKMPGSLQIVLCTIVTGTVISLLCSTFTVSPLSLPLISCAKSGWTTSWGSGVGLLFC